MMPILQCQPVTKKQVFFLLFYFYYFWFAVKQHSAQESGFKALSNKNHSKFIKKNISIFCEKLNQKSCSCEIVTKPMTYLFGLRVLY